MLDINSQLADFFFSVADTSFHTKALIQNKITKEKSTNRHAYMHPQSQWGKITICQKHCMGFYIFPKKTFPVQQNSLYIFTHMFFSFSLNDETVLTFTSIMHLILWSTQHSWKLPSQCHSGAIIGRFYIPQSRNRSRTLHASR